MVQYLKRDNKPDLAFVYSEGADAHLPVVMFCGGYASDMQGSKATYFEEACVARGQGYVRFDYSGHGQSGGDFVDGTIGSWASDARDIFEHVIADQHAVIVGSSMGGWIGLLLAREKAAQITGYIGIAAAPDFTEELYYDRLDDVQRATVMEEGRVLIPNDYSDDPYIFTRELFEDGKANCLLSQSYNPSYKMHLFQGMLDKDVHPDMAKRIVEAYSDLPSVTFIDDGDHRLSRDQDLVMIDAMIQEFSHS